MALSIDGMKLNVRSNSTSESTSNKSSNKESTQSESSSNNFEATDVRIGLKNLSAKASETRKFRNLNKLNEGLDYLSEIVSRTKKLTNELSTAVGETRRAKQAEINKLQDEFNRILQRTGNGPGFSPQTNGTGPGLGPDLQVPTPATVESSTPVNEPNTSPVQGLTQSIESGLDRIQELRGEIKGIRAGIRERVDTFREQRTEIPRGEERRAARKALREEVRQERSIIREKRDEIRDISRNIRSSLNDFIQNDESPAPDASIQPIASEESAPTQVQSPVSDAEFTEQELDELSRPEAGELDPTVEEVLSLARQEISKLEKQSTSTNASVANEDVIKRLSDSIDGLVILTDSKAALEASKTLLDERNIQIDGLSNIVGGQIQQLTQEILNRTVISEQNQIDKPQLEQTDNSGPQNIQAEIFQRSGALRAGGFQTGGSLLAQAGNASALINALLPGKSAPSKLSIFDTNASTKLDSDSLKLNVRKANIIDEEV